LELETHCSDIWLELDVCCHVIQLELEFPSSDIQLELDVCCHVIQLELDVYLSRCPVEAGCSPI
jgi:hypothetical protein